MLAAMHYDGEGGPKDAVEARRLYGLAAAQGDDTATTRQRSRTWHHAQAKEGHGGPQDFAEARRLHRLAAVFWNGTGGPVDHAEARRLFGLAAAQGYAVAQKALHAFDLSREEETQRAKKQADADAMMAQLLAEDEEEKKVKTAKSIKSKRAKKKRGRPPAASADGVEADKTATATEVDAVGAVAHLLEQAGLQVPSDDGAAAPATAAVPMALDMPPPPPAADAGASTGGRGRGRAPGSRGRGGRYGLGGRGLGGRGGVVAGTVAHQTDLGQASLQQVPEGPSYVDAALPVAAAAPAPLDMPPPPPIAVTSLADAQFSTGRPEPPESTIGGQSTCIICFTNPKTHLAAPCGHQCACADCSAQMHECPVCRTPVQMWMQVRVA